MKLLIAKNGKQWPGPFPAIQWTGDPAEISALARFVRKDESFKIVPNYMSEDYDLVVTDDDATEHTLVKTEWLIRDGGGVLRRATNSDVQEFYKVTEAAQ